MGFSTALSGLKAASTTLGVTGNNIANSQTVGFKESRAQFGDVYVSSLGSVGKSAVGTGVRVSSVAQQFKQGNIEPTANALDLALSGEGFFALGDLVDPIIPDKPLEATSFTRNGAFHLNNKGNVVDDNGRYLLAFKPTGTTVAEGFDVGVKLPLKINTDQGSPTATTSVDMQLNLNGSAEVAVTPFAFTTPGTAPYIPDPKTYTHTTSITTYDSLGNAHIASTYFCKTAVPNEWDAYTFIDGRSLQPGVQEDVYAVPPVAATGAVALAAGEITSTPTRVTFDALGHLVKVSPSATTTDLAVSAAALAVINADKAEAAKTTAELATKAALERMTSSTSQEAMACFTATKNIVDDAANKLAAANNAVSLADSQVNDPIYGTTTLLAAYTGPTTTATGAADPTYQSLVSNDAAAQLKLANAQTAAQAADTYNTTVTTALVYPAGTPYAAPAGVTDPLLLAQDARDNAKIEYDAVVQAVGITKVPVALQSAINNTIAATTAWNTATATQGTATTTAAGAAIQMTNAIQARDTALAADKAVADAAAAAGLAGAVRTPNTKIDFGGIDFAGIDPAIKVAPFTFTLDLAASTQFSTPFTVNDLKQNGLPVGNLTGVDVDKTGIVYAKYSNGFAKPIGQVALARFPSNQDLAKVGATTWLATADSGSPIYGAGGDNNFGTIQSSAIENSNVDLSEQLVKLIVAQQAYQANSQTITTEKSLVDTILRI